MPLATVSGRKVYYEIHGDAPGTPLVLVMGMAGSCKGWLALQVPDFAPHHRTLIYENRGVGESEDPGGPFTTADLADDLAGLLDALSVRRANVLGAFLGGMTAQELALRHPARVAKLILVGTYARPDAKRRLLIEKWREMARHDFGAFNTPVALGIAVLKAVLVVLFFMHVKYSPRLTRLVVVSAFVWLAIMIVGTLHDYYSPHINSRVGVPALSRE